MKKIKLLIGLFGLLSLPSFASMAFYDSLGVSLGVSNRFKCSTGVSCSKNAAGQMVVTSTADHTLTLEDDETISNASDVVYLTADDDHADFNLVGFEGKNAYLTFQADQGDDSGDEWALQAIASTDNFIIANEGAAKLTMTTAGAISLVGSVAGDGGDALSGFLQNQVAATATTITASQCGSSFVNSGAVVINLPEASTAIGCRLTFIVGNASNFDINPDNADLITYKTNSAGDAVRSATLGTSITLEAISAVNWAVQSIVSEAAWSDIN